MTNGDFPNPYWNREKLDNDARQKRYMLIGLVAAAIIGCVLIVLALTHS